MTNYYYPFFWGKNVDLVVATVLASSARHIGNSTPRINNKRKSLRWRPDPEPRRVIPSTPNCATQTLRDEIKEI